MSGRRNKKPSNSKRREISFRETIPKGVKHQKRGELSEDGPDDPQ